MIRYIHLLLAIVASVFFALAAVTGIVIGINNIDLIEQRILIKLP